MTGALLLPHHEPSTSGSPPPEGRSHRRGSLPLRLLRYAGVSGIATMTSLTVLLVLVGLAGMPAAWSNVVATAVGTVPSFELNRRWVWRCRGRRSPLRQVVPFTVLSFTGLLASTVTVALVSDHTMGWSHWGHTVAVECANISAYGSLWVVQYIVLDRFLFGKRVEQDRHHGTDPHGVPASAVERQASHGPTSTAASGGRRATRPCRTGSLEQNPQG